MRAPKTKWLHHYSTRFNCVEGNSTFYGIPSSETARRWAGETIDGFRFALKFPRLVSHDKSLIDAQLETEAFLNVVSILASADRLGPTFLQLSPHFGPRQFEDLESYLRQLPTEFPYALEVRHPDWYLPEIESELDAMLEELAVDRVVFDSRPLFSAPPTDDYETKAQNRKPKVPIRKQTTGQFPLLRLIGRNEVSFVDPWIEEWADQVAEWVRKGLTPFVFTHTPDDEFAPQLAFQFHQRLMTLLKGLEPLPDWETPPPEQKSLF